MDIKFNEETDETILTLKYRFADGHPFEGDIEHIISSTGVQLLVSILNIHIDRVKNKYLVEKSLQIAEESNPLRNNNDRKA